MPVLSFGVGGFKDGGHGRSCQQEPVFLRIAMIAHTNAPWTPHFARFFLERGDAFLLISFAPYPLDGVEEADVEFVGVEPFNFRRNKHLFVTSPGYSRVRPSLLVTRITRTGCVRTGGYTALPRQLCKSRLFMTFGNAMNNPG